MIALNSVTFPFSHHAYCLHEHILLHRSYLETNDWNLEEAIEEASGDEEWERQLEQQRQQQRDTEERKREQQQQQQAHAEHERQDQQQSAKESRASDNDEDPGESDCLSGLLRAIQLLLLPPSREISFVELSSQV